MTKKLKETICPISTSNKSCHDMLFKNGKQLYGCMFLTNNECSFDEVTNKLAEHTNVGVVVIGRQSNG